MGRSRDKHGGFIPPNVIALPRKGSAGHKQFHYVFRHAHGQEMPSRFRTSRTKYEISKVGFVVSRIPL